MSDATREQRMLGIVQRARSRPARFRDERITMAHGAGGKASQSLIEGLVLPALGGEELGAARGRGQAAACKAPRSRSRATASW